MTAVLCYERSGGPKLSSRVSYLCSLLLLYLEPQDAFPCLVNLIGTHFFTYFVEVHLRASSSSSRRSSFSSTSEREWRLRCADKVFARELPELMSSMQGRGISLSHFLPDWLCTLFVCTLSLDAAARVWDCYLRDGEVFVWRVALELLRLLAPSLLEAGDTAALLDILLHASTLGAVSEKSLFHSLSSNDAVLPELLADFSQRLPMPTAESGGVCFDLWANSIPQEAGAQEEQRPSGDGDGGGAGSGSEPGDSRQNGSST